MMACLIITIVSGAAILRNEALASTPKTETSIEQTPQERPDCRYCDGKGTYDCDYCDATGTRPCSMCNGEGVIVTLNGNKETCQACNGKGGFKCGYCKHGQRTCNTCKGTGKVRYVGE